MGDCPGDATGSLRPLRLPQPAAASRWPSPSTAAAKSSSAADLAPSCRIKVLSTPVAQRGRPQRVLRQNAVYSSEKAVSVPGELLPIPEGRHPRTFRRGGETRRDYTKPVNGFASLLELAGLCIGRRPAATALKEADIADPSFIDELEKSGFIDQLYAAYRPLPALSGSPLRDHVLPLSAVCGLPSYRCLTSKFEPQ